MGLVDGKAGVVTGAAGGLGRACAVLLAAEGASVVVNDLEAQRAGAEETVALAEQAGGTAVFVPGDVTVEADHARLVEACVSRFGRFDLAVNNAGIDLHATVEEMTEDEWDRVLAINLKGVWLGMKHQLARLRAGGGGGSIVNVSSVAGLRAVRALPAYSASKHGVVALTQSAAREAGDAGVRVNCVCPGAMRTPMLEALDPDHAAKLVLPQAIRRLAEASEVAEAVAWLLSDRASAVTGTALTVDLGLSAGLPPRD